MSSLIQTINQWIDWVYLLEPTTFLFIFFFLDIFAAYICYKTWKKWRKINVKDWLIILMWATMGLFLCFISPFRPDLKNAMKHITDNLSAFGPIITALLVAWISVWQYSVMNAQKELAEKQDARQQEKEKNERIADLNYLNLYLHLRLEYLLKFYNFVEKCIPLITRIFQQEKLTEDEMIILNTVPVDQNIGIECNLNKFTYTSDCPGVLKILTYVETNLKFLNSAVEAYRINCKTLDINLFKPTFKNFEEISYITASSIYYACKTIKQYNQEYSKLDLNLDAIKFTRAERSFLAKALINYRKQIRKVNKIK